MSNDNFINIKGEYFMYIGSLDRKILKNTHSDQLHLKRMGIKKIYNGTHITCANEICKGNKGI